MARGLRTSGGGAAVDPIWGYDRTLQGYAMEMLMGDFLEGRFDLLRHRGCPYCGERALLYSVVWTGDRAGATIGCGGRCGAMLFHVDGRFPEWTRHVRDWDLFSAYLARP